MDLRDSRGCLTEAGFRALDAAGVGPAPHELASHLAGCSRCQERLLLRDAGPRKPRQEAPPVWRGPVVALGLLLLGLGLLLGALFLRRPG